MNIFRRSYYLDKYVKIPILQKLTQLFLISRLPYFVGTMDNEKAYRLLLNQPEGTFLLRENHNGDLRATIRSNLRDGIL